MANVIQSHFNNGAIGQNASGLHIDQVILNAKHLGRLKKIQTTMKAFIITRLASCRTSLVKTGPKDQ